MKFTIQKKMMILTLTVSAVMLAVTVGSYFSLQTLVNESLQKSTVYSAFRNHMQADMMHDAIRADVLNILKITTPQNGVGVNEKDVLQAEADLKSHIEIFEDGIESNKKLILPSEIKTKLESVNQPLADYIAAAKKLFATAKVNHEAAEQIFPEFIDTFRVLAKDMASISGSMTTWSESKEKIIKDKESQISTGLMGAVVIVLLVLGLLIRNTAHWVFRPLKNIVDVMVHLSKGNTDIAIEGTQRHDEIGEIAKTLDVFKGSIVDSARQKLALDMATSNIMMADENFNIVYLNSSVTSFLKEAESDIKKDLPRFSIEGLMGANIDIFHKNPAHQRGMLEKLTSTYKTSILVGGRSFNLVASPVYGKNNQRLGTVVEWIDGAAAGIVEAVNRSQAVIEFHLDGTIINANENFLNAMGYRIEEIRGKHHSMFVDLAYKESAEYRKFWDDLNRGEPCSGEFKRFGKGGKEIWINGSYSPVLDLRGKVVRVVKTASDVTEMVMVRTENEQGMSEAVRVLSGIAAGNLMQKMEIDYKGTFAQIKTAVNSTVDRLYGMVKQIIEAAQSVNSAATEISSGSTDLSQRTEEQASSLEETAASMEEITGTVKQNSSNAATANDLSTKANVVASDGGRVVEEAVTAMNNIEKSSKKISDIIGVIDEIAFQTNLLALNAAVEAARAGDAGKGFAVVASEVRSLAGRSASASKEIKALINESAVQVSTGAQLVNQAGETLKGIVSSVKQVSEIISEIAAASVEQATGIDEINSAITQMDEVTQQNAALVEENTAAAQSMVEQAQSLEKLMRFFTLDENESDSDDEGDHPNIVALNASRPVPSKTKTASTKTIKQKPKAVVKPTIKTAKAAGTKKVQDGGWEEF